MRWFVRGRHYRKSSIGMWRWVQLFVGILLTYVGLSSMAIVVEKGDSANGDLSAPAEFGIGSVMFLVGVVMLINLIKWALSGRD